MTIAEAVTGRRSIRAYLDKPVPQALLEKVLATAQYSPSGYNFQPWEAVVLAGDRLRALSTRMLAAEPQQPPEYPLVPEALGEIYKARRDEGMVHRMAAMGIDREDAAARAEFVRNNFRIYGAPALMLTFIPRVMGPPQWSDVGMWLQTVMLTLHGEGLGSCALESLYNHARLIKSFTGVSDETHLFFCGMAIGWADPEAPVNRFPRNRAPLGEVVRFEGFETAGRP